MSYSSKYGRAVVPMHEDLAVNALSLLPGAHNLVSAGLGSVIANAARNGPFSRWINSGASTPMEFTARHHVTDPRGPWKPGELERYFGSRQYLFNQKPYLRSRYPEIWNQTRYKVKGLQNILTNPRIRKTMGQPPLHRRHKIPRMKSMRRSIKARKMIRRKKKTKFFRRKLRK